MKFPLYEIVEEHKGATSEKIYDVSGTYVSEIHDKNDYITFNSRDENVYLLYKQLAQIRFGRRRSTVYIWLWVLKKTRVSLYIFSIVTAIINFKTLSNAYIADDVRTFIFLSA